MCAIHNTRHVSSMFEMEGPSRVWMLRICIPAYSFWTSWSGYPCQLKTLICFSQPIRIIPRWLVWKRGASNTKTSIRVGRNIYMQMKSNTQEHSEDMVMRSSLLLMYKDTHSLPHKHTHASFRRNRHSSTWRQWLNLYVFEHQTCSSQCWVWIQVVIITHTNTHCCAMLGGHSGTWHGEAHKGNTRERYYKCRTINQPIE